MCFGVGRRSAALLLIAQGSTSLTAPEHFRSEGGEPFDFAHSLTSLALPERSRREGREPRERRSRTAEANIPARGWGHVKNNIRFLFASTAMLGGFREIRRDSVRARF